VKFLSRGSGYGLFLTADGAVLGLCGGASETGAEPSRALKPANCETVRLQVVGARPSAPPRGEGQLSGTANYFIGRDPAKWRVGIPMYDQVRYAGIYPGIDLVYYGNHRRLEYDFVARPGANLNQIRLRFDGARGIERAGRDLLVKTAHGELVLEMPQIYQLVDGRRVSVEGRFALLGKRTAGFRLGPYDHTRELTIDPALDYSTYLGGSGGDSGKAIAIDASGNAYIAGQTYSTDFPITSGAWQTTNNGAAKHVFNAFVTKLNADGTALVYSTYLGGSGGNQAFAQGDAAVAIAVDGSGNAYVTGLSGSEDFPVTAGALQAKNKAAANGDITAFVAKLNPAGTSLVYSTYLGGSGTAANAPFAGDTGTSIAVNSAGEAYVAGSTYSTDFPVTAGALQGINNSAATGGNNGFVTRLNAAGTGLVYSTYLGGSGSSAGIPFASDTCNAISLDAAGDAYVTGQTLSKDFPVTASALQTRMAASGADGANAFVSELDPAGNSLVYSTYLGGSLIDAANAIAVDAAGDAYVAGLTYSSDFPVTAGAYQAVNNGAADHSTNGFVSKLNPAGSALLYSTYLGGRGGQVNLTSTVGFEAGDQINGLAIDGAGNAFVTGETASPDFPVTAAAYQAVNQNQAPGCPVGCYGGFNAFVTELNPAGSALNYSTYLGGNGFNPTNPADENIEEGDEALGLAVDIFDSVYVTGNAESGNFPVTAGSFQPAIHGIGNAFVSKLNLAAPVGPAAPMVTVTPAPATIGSAQSLPVAVSVAGESGDPKPTGTVTLEAGSYTSAPVELNGGGATITVPAGSLPASPANRLAPDFVTANYLPRAASEAEYGFGSGSAEVEVVAPVIAVAPPSPSISWAQALGQALEVTIGLATAGSLPAPTGNVILSTGGYSSPATVLTGASARIDIPAGTLATGLNVLAVSYSGDKVYLAEAGTGTVTVGPITVAVTVVPSAGSITTAQTLPVTVTVSAGSGHATPTGTVTLASGSYSSAETALIEGSAKTTIPAGALVVGSDTLSAAYSGDGNYASAIGSAMVMVTQAPVPGFTIGGTAVTVLPGAVQGNTSTISVTPSGGFTGAVSLQASITSMPEMALQTPVLTFGATGTVEVTGTGPATAILSISTAAAGASPCGSGVPPVMQNAFYPAGGTALAGILLFGIRGRRKKWRSLLGMVTLGVAMATGIGACNGKLICLLPALTGTTPGSYTVTVTGTSGSISATATVPLTVE
jgi:hypothetical protein